LLLVLSTRIYVRPTPSGATRPPTDNPFIESFNGSVRDECLNVNWFLSLGDAKEEIQLFKGDYNGFRPHSSLSGLTPNEVVQQHSNGPIFPTLAWAVKLGGGSTL
jgi:putative transposase